MVLHDKLAASMNFPTVHLVTHFCLEGERACYGIIPIPGSDKWFGWMVTDLEEDHLKIGGNEVRVDFYGWISQNRQNMKEKLNNQVGKMTYYVVIGQPLL